jgi:hypothetical protein
VLKERELREEVAKRLSEQVGKEKALREEVAKRLSEEVGKERALREEAVKHERELRAEAVRAAEAQVDRRVLDLLYAEEYVSVRAKLQGVKKRVRRMLNHHDK